MSYPPYTVPDATGITWNTGGATDTNFPGQYLSTEAQANEVLAVLGGKLVNAALDPVPNVVKISGVDPTAALQPWYILGGGKYGEISNWVGIAVAAQEAYNPTNGGGVGNPGKYELDYSKGYARLLWDPEAPPIAPPATSSDNSLFNFGGQPQGFTDADRALLNRIVAKLGA